MATGERFSRELKIMIVKQVIDGKRPVDEVSQEYALGENTVRKWVRQYKENPERAFPGSGHTSDESEEVTKLRLRVKQLEEEVAFLQRVSTYFVARPRNTCK